MINFVLWKWRQRPVFRESYGAVHVNEMVRQLDKFCTLPHRIVLITDNPKGASCPTYPLWIDHGHVPNVSGCHLPSCYRRLRIFDPDTLRDIGIPAGERVVSVDLDAIVTRVLDPLFDRREPFVGWTVKGGRRDTVLNGSMFMFTAGEYAHVWRTFDPRTSPMRALNAGFMGSDQGWLSRCLVDTPGLGGWTRRDGVLSFTRDVVRGGVPADSGRVVFFAGSRKPWHAEVQKSAPWVQRYVNYQEEEARVAVAS